VAVVKKCITALAVYLCLNVPAFAVASADYTITYKNQQGSTLTLTWHPEKNNAGILSGLLTSKGGSCSQGAGMPAAVSGVFAGNAVALTVSYPKCDKVLAMTGNLKNNNTELQMLWLVTAQAKDYIRDNAGVNQVGADSYVKIAS
jgi:hypothetical protein